MVSGSLAAVALLLQCHCDLVEMCNDGWLDRGVHQQFLNMGNPSFLLGVLQ